MASPGYNAGVELGKLLFGQHGNGPLAQDKALYRGARAANVFQAALKNRSEAIRDRMRNEALQNAGATFTHGFGVDPVRANALGQIARMAYHPTPAAVIGEVPLSRAVLAAQTGDDASLNRNIAAAHGKLLPLADIQGNTAINNPYTAPEFAPTDIGSSIIGRNQAQAGEDAAAAARNRAHAGLYTAQTTTPDKFHAPHREDSDAVFRKLRRMLHLKLMTPDSAVKLARESGYPDVAKKIAALKGAGGAPGSAAATRAQAIQLMNNSVNAK